MLVLGSSSMVTLLLCLVDLASSFPSHFAKPSVPLNEFIKHYEPAFYDVEEVTNQHRRIKRKAGISEKVTIPLKLTISTSNRVFKLLLRPDSGLFAEDVEFEGTRGRKIDFDPGTVYVGTLEDDDRAQVRGIITKDGLFDGTVTTQFEEFYIEPVHRYTNKADYDRVHTIVYRTSDVLHPETSLCAISTAERKNQPTDLNTIAHRSERKRRQTLKIKPDTDGDRGGWPEFRNLFLLQNQKSRQSSRNGKSSLSALLSSTYTSMKPARESVDLVSPASSDGAFYDLDFVNLSSELNLAKEKPSAFEDDGKRYEFNDDHLHPLKPNSTIQENNSKHWRPKSGLIDTVYKYTNLSKNSKGGYLPPSGIIHKSNQKILIGSGPEESHTNLIITSDDSLEQHARKRVMVDPKKTTCMLYLQADHLFFEKYGTEETCIEVMTRHVQRVNSIYRNTDFNQDGKPDNISFMIKRIKVHSVKDPSYRFPGNYGVEKFLEIFSEEDYDAFCLAYMFTYRDFEMGTLGLAWTGDLKNAGGVCEKNGHYRGSLKSLNTGIVTVLNYGKHVPSAVSHVTLAHEIGHNFGSPHDPDGCTPGGEDGNFIMFARATSGDKKNNNKFSLCSLHAINPVLNAKARSAKGCFTEPQTSICGNGVVEPGEECDCGWEEDCRDSCCYPQRRYPPLDEMPCRLTPRANCSPSQGPCCSTNCELKRGDMCRNDNGCRDSSYCDGFSPQCPPSVNKPNKTVCNEEFVCYMGECTGSICLAYGLESCQCIPTPADSSTKACELCCKVPGENQPCLSSFQWNQSPYDVPDMYAKPGTPCNDYNGYCDVFKKCREVDPSGPIATLRKLLLSEENIASFKKWALDHWYYCGLIFLSFLLLMILSTKMLGKKPKVKSVTVLHSSPTETVRLPADGSGGLAVVVHPVAVRSKLPFRKKVYENKRRGKSSPKEETVPHNVNNNNSPVEAKKKPKKRVDTKSNAKISKNKETKSSKKETVVTSTKANENLSDDPLGKVRNWLISSHNIDSFGSLKKSKSSPADFDLSDPTGAKKRAQRATIAAAATDAAAAAKSNPTNGVAATTAAKVEAKKGGKAKDNRVKLQVVYKPPFKFSVKLGKNKNEISSHLIRDKRPEAVKQRAALFVRADRIRANAASPVANVKTTKTKNTKSKANGVDVDKKETTRSARVEYKRSVSAPQSEPVYQNTLIDVAGGVHDEKRISEEPKYANVLVDEGQNGVTKNPFLSSTETEIARNRTRASHQSMNEGVKRRNSSDVRAPVTKQQHANLSKVSSVTRRRNSCDAGVANKSVEMTVKRQHSAETDVKANGRSPSDSTELKRDHLRSSRASPQKSNVVVANSSKPVKLKCSYDMETSNLMTPSITITKSSKRKNSAIQGENPFSRSRTKEKRSNVRRSMSNSAAKNDSEKIKRHSLQHVDLMHFSRAEDNKSHVPHTAMSRELSEALSYRPVDLTLEIPSDMESLLCEGKNST